MNFLFAKKQPISALAELLEDGRAVMNQELKKAKYNQYAGAEPLLEILVRVFPPNEAPFEARMKAGLSKADLLIAGVRVQVKFEAGKPQSVVLDDEIQTILERNPQLSKS